MSILVPVVIMVAAGIFVFDTLVLNPTAGRASKIGAWLVMGLVLVTHPKFIVLSDDPLLCASCGGRTGGRRPGEILLKPA